jgi:hypothetical protein
MFAKNLFKPLYILGIVPALLVFMLISTPAFSANYPLEIINIKPAGTGSPAIPASNRIFRAYPGIEYNIRAAVIGGLYPFTFKLTNAPAGMTVNPSTGEIIWPNPQQSAGPITLSVTDAENTTVSTTWSINVTTNGFVFVDSKYSGTSTGSFSQPFKSIQEVTQNANSLSRTDILYFRGGNYRLVAFDSWMPWTGDVTGQYAIGLTKIPSNWIGFPGETVNIDGDRRYITAENLWFDNLRLSNFSDYGIVTESNYNYNTVRRTVWSNLEAVRSANNNYGFYFTRNHGPGYYTVIQDSEFRNFKGASAIGSLYNTKKMLIEDNYIHSSLGGGISGINNGIAPKYYTDHLFIRGNRVIMNSGTPLAWYLNSSFVETKHADISFNYFSQTGSGGVVHRWNPHGTQGRLNYYRNTAVGAVHDFRSDPCGKGPFNFYDNVFIHSTNGLNRSCVNYSNNLTGSLTGNVVDSSGNLTSAYGSYIGTHGYQVDFSTAPSDPIISAPQAPQGLRIVN